MPEFIIANLIMRACCTVVLSLCAVVDVTLAVSNGQSFDFYLLVNSGLLPPVAASSFGSCINLCRAAVGSCSAVSYNPGSGQCVRSPCSIVTVVKNNGWNTYLLFMPKLESLQYTAPAYEWILTDSCGLSSSGTVPGVPAMNLTYGISYNSSQSQYVGKALRFTRNTTVYAVTATPFFSIGTYASGITLSGWYYYDGYSYPHPYFEFGTFTNGSWTFGSQFWFYSVGLYYSLVDWSFINPVDGAAALSAPMTTWIHVALVYDLSVQAISIFCNGSLYYVRVLNSPLTNITKSYNLLVGARPNQIFNGLDGRVYCMKIHTAALSPSDVWANALACNGRVRFG